MPIRMCIGCKKKDERINFFRLQIKDNKLIFFSGKGRSFYVCKECINSKKLVKLLKKKYSLKEEEIKKLRSVLENKSN